MLALVFPPLDPVAVSLGPIVIRWYALAYLAGFVLGWRYCLYLARKNPKGPTPQQYDDFLTWAVIGTVLGGRLGYILFYQPEYYFSDPMAIFQIWHGGMSFHGGMLGVTAAMLWFAYRRKIHVFDVSDLVACILDTRAQKLHDAVITGMHAEQPVQRLRSTVMPQALVKGMPIRAS